MTSLMRFYAKIIIFLLSTINSVILPRNFEFALQKMTCSRLLVMTVQYGNESTNTCLHNYVSVLGCQPQLYSKERDQIDANVLCSHMTLHNYINLCSFYYVLTFNSPKDKTDIHRGVMGKSKSKRIQNLHFYRN